MAEARRRPAPPLTLLAGEREDGETDSAMIACNDFLRLGPGRTLGLLDAKYAKTRRSTPPTDSIHTIKEWSAKFHWLRRASEFDAGIEEEKNAERERVMRSGFANDYERVREIDKMIRFLLGEIRTKAAPQEEAPPPHPEGTRLPLADGDEPPPQPMRRRRVRKASENPNVWLRDAKQMGAGEQAEVVEIERFNSQIFEVLRGFFDDMAKETGGRKQNLEHSGTLRITLSAEELAAAREELDKWERERFGAGS